jgi:hypothetical protein
VSRPSQWEREAAKATSDFARKAIRRLDVLEWVILAVTAGLAIGGGALVALLMERGAGLAFRATWIVTSLILFIVPGAVVLWSLRKEGGGWGGRPGARKRDDG